MRHMQARVAGVVARHCRCQEHMNMSRRTNKGGPQEVDSALVPPPGASLAAPVIEGSVERAVKHTVQYVV